MKISKMLDSKNWLNRNIFNSSHYFIYSLSSSPVFLPSWLLPLLNQVVTITTKKRNTTTPPTNSITKWKIRSTVTTTAKRNTVTATTLRANTGSSNPTVTCVQLNTVPIRRMDSSLRSSGNTSTITKSWLNLRFERKYECSFLQRAEVSWIVWMISQFA